MWFSKLIRWSCEQDLFKSDIFMFFDLIDSFPDQVLILSRQFRSNDIGALSDGEVYIFEEKIIFSEVAQDIWITGRVLKQLCVFDELEIVIVFIDGIERNFI